MLCTKAKVKHILNVKNRWQKTSGLRKVANMFQSFFKFSLLALFSLPWPPCCLSISSCSSPPQIVLFLILLYFLNPLSAYAHCSSHSISNIHHNCKLYRSSWQCSSWIKSPNIIIKELMFNIFSHFQIIMLMLRLEVGEGERYVIWFSTKAITSLWPLLIYCTFELRPDILSNSFSLEVSSPASFLYIEDKNFFRTSFTPNLLGMPFQSRTSF